MEYRSMKPWTRHAGLLYMIKRRHPELFPDAPGYEGLFPMDMRLELHDLALRDETGENIKSLEAWMYAHGFTQEDMSDQKVFLAYDAVRTEADLWWTKYFERERSPEEQANAFHSYQVVRERIIQELMAQGMSCKEAENEFTSRADTLDDATTRYIEGVKSRINRGRLA